MTGNLPDTMTAEQMRHAIMLTVKANGLSVDGEFWLMLAFRTDSELRSICHDIHIPAIS